MPSNYMTERSPSLRERLRAARLVLATAALVLLPYAAFGVLSLPFALLSFAAITAAALLGAGPPKLAVTERVPDPPDRSPGSLIESLISHFPDPIIVVDTGGAVMAFNAHAGTLAPALRRGQALSLALRVPELVGAIRQAASGGGSQRVEISERVPVDRWLAAYVVPLEVPDP